MVRPAPDLTGRTCVITGATRGIGRAAAEGIARTGMRVVLLTRRVADGEAVGHALTAATGNAAVEVVAAELASLADVRGAAETIRARHPRVHALVNNAAVALKRRQLSRDGIEMTVAVNHLAHFVLTLGLLDALRAAAPSRVVNVSSEAHQRDRIDFRDLELERRYGGVKAYGRSKLMNVLFSNELARRLDGTGVTVNAMHPGVIATGLLTDYLPTFLQPFVPRFAGTPEAGADTLVWMVTSPELEGVTGRYFIRRKPASPNPMALDREAARGLWRWSAERTGLAAGPPVAHA
ncbi:MAG TPA: SDR family oxidoreductase [Gemmatimonadales bacterium]|nr:SDR family oxidoreductase [Gemmatimonadales bacterium]